MLLNTLRKLLIVAIAVAVVFPPLSGLVDSALGISSEHAHFDHVWHQVTAADAHTHTPHDDSNDQAEKGQAHLGHIHMAVMAFTQSVILDAARPPAIYQSAVKADHPGRALAPPARPPRPFS